MKGSVALKSFRKLTEGAAKRGMKSTERVRDGELGLDGLLCSYSKM